MKQVPAGMLKSQITRSISIISLIGDGIWLTTQRNSSILFPFKIQNFFSLPRFPWLASFGFDWGRVASREENASVPHSIALIDLLQADCRWMGAHLHFVPFHCAKTHLNIWMVAERFQVLVRRRTVTFDYSIGLVNIADNQMVIVFRQFPMKLILIYLRWSMYKACKTVTVLCFFQ